MFKQFRRYVAGYFGRIEHHSGELLGILLCTKFCLVFFLSWSWLRHWSVDLLLVIIWLIYFISHRLEKKIYGKYGYR